MTHASRTHSRRLERCTILACGLMAVTGSAAHGLVGNAIPNEVGARVGASLALSWLNADAAIPMATLPGILLSGNRQEDRDGFGLEHGVIDAGVRFNETIGATLAMGWHGTDVGHVEAAWLEARRGNFNLGLGRNRVPLGPVITHAGHMDRFALMPLAKQAAFDGDWIEDGLNLRWRHGGPGDLEFNAGLWRAKTFPGVDDSNAAPSLHVGGYLGNVRLDGFVARIKPEKRGTSIQQTSDGHSHAAPTCAESLTGLVCFDGSSDIGGVSARWHAATLPFEVSVAGIIRRERGDLYSTIGDTDYSGDTRGGWIEAAWTLRPEWIVLLRSERLVAEHDLTGFGASLVARDAGFLPDPGATTRHALSVAWLPRKDMTVTAEIGSERADGDSNGYVGLRFLWTGDWRLGR
jgi:hypothetical protein